MRHLSIRKTQFLEGFRATRRLIPAIITIFLSSLLGFSQDCEVKKETDPYTKKVKISSGFIPLSKNTLTIDADKNEVDLLFIIPEKCFEPNNKLEIYFEGSKIKTTYLNKGSLNCEGFYHINFKNTATTPALLQKISTKKIAQLIFTSNDKKTTIITLQPAEQEMVMQKTNCIVIESKKLL